MKAIINNMTQLFSHPLERWSIKLNWGFVTIEKKENTELSVDLHWTAKGWEPAARYHHLFFPYLLLQSEKRKF